MDPDAQIDLPDEITAAHSAGILTTYWPSAVALALALVTVALLIRSLRQRRNHRTHSRTLAIVGLIAATAALLTAALALGVNTWAGYFPSIPALQRWLSSNISHPTPSNDQPAPNTPNPAPHGTAEAPPTQGHSYQTEIAPTAAHVTGSAAWVYVPPGYDRPGNTDRYPVIYALHGAPGGAADWFTGGQVDATLDTLISAGSIAPTIVVAPQVNAGANQPYDEPLDLPGGPQLETYVRADVVQWADQNLRTLADPQHRIIAGMSAGGLGALISGLHHPDVFGGVVSIMPYTTPYTASITGNVAALRNNSPLEVIANRTQQRSLAVFLGQGDGEATTEATQIRDALRAQGEVTTLRVLPNLGHTWTAAKTIMPYGLIWAAKQLGWGPPGPPR